MTRSEVARRVPEGTEVRGWALTCAPPDTRAGQPGEPVGCGLLGQKEFYKQQNSLAKRILQQNSLARHWARDWRALALTQVHQKERKKESYNKTPSHDTRHGTGAHSVVRERKKTDKPKEGWEDGTPPPHRDFTGRNVCS